MASAYASIVAMADQPPTRSLAPTKPSAACSMPAGPPAVGRHGCLLPGRGGRLEPHRTSHSSRLEAGLKLERCKAPLPLGEGFGVRERRVSAHRQGESSTSAPHPRPLSRWERGEHRQAPHPQHSVKWPCRRTRTLQAGEGCGHYGLRWHFQRRISCATPVDRLSRSQSLPTRQGGQRAAGGGHRRCSDGSPRLGPRRRGRRVDRIGLTRGAIAPCRPFHVAWPSHRAHDVPVADGDGGEIRRVVYVVRLSTRVR